MKKPSEAVMLAASFFGTAGFSGMFVPKMMLPNSMRSVLLLFLLNLGQEFCFVIQISRNVYFGFNGTDILIYLIDLWAKRRGKNREKKA